MTGEHADPSDQQEVEAHGTASERPAQGSRVRGSAGPGHAARGGHRVAAPRGTRPTRPARNRRADPARDGPRVRRLPVLALVVALLLAGGLASAMVAGPPVPTGGQPAATSLAAMAAPVSSAASSWYCTGATGPANPIAQGTLYLVSSSHHAVKGTLTVYDSTGHTAKEAITVPALGEATATPGTISSGFWLASRVDLDGGGVAVSQLVAGSTGWSMAPCSTEANASWYFASGATSTGNSLYVSLFNPTRDTAVVDLTFVTGQGSLQPAPFQGLIIAPDAVVTAQVGSYVQDQSSVATVVRARSGQVVAAELQLHSSGGQSGESLRLGAPGPATRWYLPSSKDATGGTSQLVVFNPTHRTEHVEVDVQLPSGPVAPLDQTVGPQSTWTLALSGQTRIPANTTYAVTVATTGGAGVVVDRVTDAPAAAPAPQWGAVSAVCGPATTSPTGDWTLANPALNAAQAEPGAKPVAVALLNPGSRPVRATVSSLGAGGRPLQGASALRIAPHALAVIPANGVGAGGLAALRVSADHAVVAAEDVLPSGATGAVAAPAVPQG